MPAADWSVVATNLGMAAGAIVAGLVAHAIVFKALKRIAARTHSLLDDSIATHCSRPLELVFPLLALDIVMPSLRIPAAVNDPVRHVIALLLIAGVARLCVRATLVGEDLLVECYHVDVPDNLKARRVRTQFEVFRRV